jgi:hypothetical protein
MSSGKGLREFGTRAPGLPLRRVTPTGETLMIATPAMFAQPIPEEPLWADFAAYRMSLPLPPRERIPPHRLVEILNHQIAVRPGCEGILISAEGLEPGVPDPEGCNWSPVGLRVAVAHGASTRALASVRQVVEWARVRFDIE